MNCSVCNKTINGYYYKDEFGNKACKNHFNSDFFICFYCGRIISEKTSKSNITGEFGYHAWKDWYMCGICGENPILSKQQIKNCLDNVIKIVKSYGIRINANNISITIISYRQFYKLKFEGIQGLCQTYFDSDGNYSHSKIFMINGVPTIYFESILAHELFHSLLHHKKIDLGDYEEGFCNIGAAIVLDHYNVSHDSKQARFLLKNLDKNPDPFYGRGYRELKEKLLKVGWREFLKYIKQTNN